MLERLAIGVFYAAIFFALGAWSGGRVEPVGRAALDIAIEVGHGAERLWAWASRGETVHANPPPPADTESAEPPVDLRLARGAFARGDLKGAIAGYKSYIVAHPDDADARGELGNVYYNSGQTAEAAGAFHAAALLLIAEGRADAARALEPVIRIAAPGLADDLARRLAAPASPPSATAADAH